MAKEAKLIGFNFTKINAERTPGYEGKIETKSNINIKSMEKVQTPSTKQESLKAEFSVEIDYGKLGRVELEGNLFILADLKLIKETLSAWANKKQPTTLQLGIVNIILQKTSIKAIQIEEEIGLPIHLQSLFPRIRPTSAEKTKE